MPYLTWFPETGLDLERHVTYSLSNTFFPPVYRNSSQYSFVDTETNSLIAQGTYEVQKIHVFGKLGFTRFSPGVTDEFIQNFHKDVQTPNGGREMWNTFNSQVQIGDPANLAVDIQGTRTFLRDPELGLYYPFSNIHTVVGLLGRLSPSKKLMGPGTSGLVFTAAHRHFWGEGFDTGIGVAAGRLGRYKRNNPAHTVKYLAHLELDLGYTFGLNRVGFLGNITSRRFRHRGYRISSPPSIMTFSYERLKLFKIGFSEEMASFTAPDFIVSLSVFF